MRVQDFGWGLEVEFLNPQTLKQVKKPAAVLAFPGFHPKVRESAQEREIHSVCVCERERERERTRDTEKEKEREIERQRAREKQRGILR